MKDKSVLPTVRAKPLGQECVVHRFLANVRCNTSAGRPVTACSTEGEERIETRNEHVSRTKG